MRTPTLDDEVVVIHVHHIRRIAGLTAGIGFALGMLCGWLLRGVL